MAICTYLLPLRRTGFDPREMRDLADYLAGLSLAGCEILIIDGSSPEAFAQHAALLGPHAVHRKVDPKFRYKNGKVNGVHTGVALASCDKIVLADDDIRYQPDGIKEVVTLLERYEVVRPQNFLRPLPWWAKMESARMLVNRGSLRAADYPGTCAFRRSTWRKVGPYDGDVLFDNEEIIRNFSSHGATVAYARDLFVEKRAPRFRKWLEQRPRQAYEDFGLRAKTIFFLTLLPLFAATLLAGSWTAVGGMVFAVALGSSLLALRGRRRGDAARYFPLSCCYFAPLWMIERSFSTYWALLWYFRRGGYPFGDQILSKGIGNAWWSGARAAAQQSMHGNLSR